MLRSVTEFADTHSVKSSKKRKTQCACIDEAHESGRKRIKETQQRDKEDNIAEKRFNSLSH